MPPKTYNAYLKINLLPLAFLVGMSVAVISLNFLFSNWPKALILFLVGAVIMFWVWRKGKSIGDAIIANKGVCCQQCKCDLDDANRARGIQAFLCSDCYEKYFRQKK